jgi:hypothetical protein
MSAYTIKNMMDIEDSAGGHAPGIQARFAIPSQPTNRRGSWPSCATDLGHLMDHEGPSRLARGAAPATEGKPASKTPVAGTPSVGDITADPNEERAPS